ncbi:threonine synthase [Elusimicrobium posterum]|uniref:threonine synthase n=1 Tax=Elusimicrobium posterum TaxID=3116653 RepID=UPI003C77481C
MKKILNLQCVDCGREYKTSDADFTCSACGGNLEINYDYKLIAKRFNVSELEKNNRFDMWRYIDILPVDDDNTPEVHVGWTPLYDCKKLADELGISKLFIKDEGRNPTGSIKDRGSAMVVSRALEIKKNVIVDASTGNASDSLACLSASLPLKTVIFTTKDAPYPKLTQLLVYGANVFMIDGTYDDAFEMAKKTVEEYGWYSRAAGYNPYSREGKKTCAFEICEQLEWEAPDKVIVAAGDGTVLAGLWKGFVDFNKLGIIEKMPQMIAVQAEGSAALKIAFENNGMVEPVKAHTVADSILVNYPRDARMALQALQESNGYVITVTDDEILNAIPELARKANLFAEPAGAAPYAGLKKLVAENKITRDESVAIVVGGNGLKDTFSVKKLLGAPQAVANNFDLVKEMIEKKELNK